MQICSQKSGSWRACAKNGAYCGLVIVLVSMGLSCATTRKTTTETTVTHSDGSAAYEEEQNEGAVGTSETTTTTTETEPKRPGVISSTFHAIGYVIALPFIIIGGLFRIIFGG